MDPQKLISSEIEENTSPMLKSSIESSKYSIHGIGDSALSKSLMPTETKDTGSEPVKYIEIKPQ